MQTTIERLYVVSSFIVESPFTLLYIFHSLSVWTVLPWSGDRQTERQTDRQTEIVFNAQTTMMVKSGRLARKQKGVRIRDCIILNATKKHVFPAQSIFFNLFLTTPVLATWLGRMCIMDIILHVCARACVRVCACVCAFCKLYLNNNKSRGPISTVLQRQVVYD